MLKALILSGCKKTNADIASDRRRFRAMSETLVRGGITAVHEEIGTAVELEELLGRSSPDIVFSAVHSVPGHDRGSSNVHDVLERLDLPFVGSPSNVLDLVLSKSSLKNLWRSSGVRTPDFFSVDPERPDGISNPPAEKLRSPSGFPYIVKPAREGNSRGIDESSVVHTSRELRERVETLSAVYGGVLVERFLGFEKDLREFTVALVGNGAGILLMPSEILLLEKRGVRVVTTDDKDERRAVAVPVRDSVLEKRLISFASKAFSATGVRDYARCDILYSGGVFYAIEINGQPMVPDPWFEACAEREDLDPVQCVNAIFLASISRNIREGFERLRVPSRMHAVLPPEAFRILSGSFEEVRP